MAADEALPFLARVVGAHGQGFLGGAAVGQDDGAARAGHVRPAFAGETDDVRVVEGVVLGADRGTEAHTHEDGELTHGGQVAGLGGAQEVAPEDAGHPGLVEEDERVGGGLEPGGDRGGQGLSGLRVVVFDEGDGQFGDRRRERAFPQARQVDVSVGDRGLVEVVVQGHVEEHGVGDLAQVLFQLAHVSAPVLADGGQEAAGGGAQVFEPARVEVGADVLDGV